MMQSLGLTESGNATITVVSDETVCRRAAFLVDSIAGLGVTTNPVYAYQIATSHWVVDPVRQNPLPSEATTAYVFDSLWSFKGTLALYGSGGRR
jgi:hypothetical protein